MNAYRIILSNGRKVVVHAFNAAQAIQSALWEYRGLTVAECYAGVKQEDAEDIRRFDRDARPYVGWVDHEVPPHGPIPEGIAKPIARSPKDTSLPMFDDEKIKSESAIAKDKFDYQKPTA